MTDIYADYNKIAKETYMFYIYIPAVKLELRQSLNAAETDSA